MKNSHQKLTKKISIKLLFYDKEKSQIIKIMGGSREMKKEFKTNFPWINLKSTKRKQNIFFYYSREINEIKLLISMIYL